MFESGVTKHRLYSLYKGVTVLSLNLVPTTPVLCLTIGDMSVTYDDPWTVFFAHLLFSVESKVCKELFIFISMC